SIENGQITDPVFCVDVYNNLANDYFRLWNLEKAVECYQKALSLLESEESESKSFARKYMEISQSYKTAGKLSIAREYAMRSLAIYEMRNEQTLVGWIHQRLGKTLEKQSDLDGAEKEYRQAIAIEQELKDEV